MRTKRRKEGGDPHAERLPDTVARLVVFDAAVTDMRGQRRTCRIRLLTTLLDHQAYPARDLAKVYAERWQVEIAYLMIKKPTALLEGLIAEDACQGNTDLSLVSVDSTTARAHHDAAGMRIGKEVMDALEEAAAEQEQARQKGAVRRSRTGGTVGIVAYGVALTMIWFIGAETRLRSLPD